MSTTTSEHTNTTLEALDTTVNGSNGTIEFTPHASGIGIETSFARPRPVGEIPQRYRINDHRRSFLDTDSFSRWDRSIFQRFPQAEKVRVTGLEAGPPGSWDARGTEITGSVLVVDGKFRMWYICQPDVQDVHENIDHNYTCYAESEDGIHWVKPDLKLTGQNRWPGNNLLPIPGHVLGVVPALPGADFKYLAATDQINPLETDITDQEKWGFEYNGAGTYFFASDDGLHWRQLAKLPLLVHGDIGCLYADHETGRYLFYHKLAMLHGLDMRRSWIGMESTDGINWEGYNGINTHRECFIADDYDDLIAARAGLRIADHYQLAVGRIGNLYVGIESMFLIGDPLKSTAGQNPNGLAYLRLAYSHNGMNWRHPKGRPPWLELGAPGDFDAGFMVTSNTFINHGDETLLYAYAGRYQHGWCINPDFTIREDIPLSDHEAQGNIFLAKMKKDRFASMAAPYKGTFDVQNTTCMERTSGRFHMDLGPRGGDHLFVNARCPEGFVRVAIIEQNTDEPLPGFSLDDCIPFSGDSVRAPIRYRSKSVAEIPNNMGLMLRFEVTRGEIFGYEWGN